MLSQSASKFTTGLLSTNSKQTVADRCRTGLAVRPSASGTSVGQSRCGLSVGQSRFGLSVFASTEEILRDMRQGKMVVIVDDEDRENEGDLVMASEFVTPETINFMALQGRGLICMTMTEARAAALELPLMVSKNRCPHGTNFTVSFEASAGVTTGSRRRTAPRRSAPRWLGTPVHRTSSAPGTSSVSLPGRGAFWSGRDIRKRAATWRVWPASSRRPPSWR